MSQTFMGSFIVVVESPQPSHLTYLAQGLKQIGIQELIPERAIETLRKSVLLWLAFLYVDHLDTMLLAPVSKGARNLFGTIIYANLVR